MDKLHAMEVFVKVAEAESFSRAAERLNLAPASVSATIANLEAALKQTQTRPQGKLRVEIPTALGHLYVAPALPAFTDKYPEMQVVMTLNDRFAELTEEEVDVILRVGKLADSTMVARQVYEARFVACAAPSYLARHGSPKSPRELGRFNCIGYFSATLGRSARWTFKRDSETYTHAPDGSLHINNGEAVVDLAIAGAGIIYMLETSSMRAIHEGKLVPVLEDWQTNSTPISVLYWPSRHLSAKVRVFVDFIAELFTQQVPHLQRPGVGADS